MKRLLCTVALGTVIMAPGFAQQIPNAGGDTQTSAWNHIVEEIELSGFEGLLPPRVDHIAVRATLLHWGMSRGDVDRIMGTPEHIDTTSSQGKDVHVLKYPAEPIAATVTIIDDKVSSVALDIAGIDDRALPMFSQSA